MTDIVSPTPIADPPAAPLVTDTPADFNSKAFSLAGWYQPLVTALNGLTANVFNNATAAQERAVAANTAATDAGTRRDEAQAARDDSRAARDAAQGWAASAVNAPGTSSTSATSLAVSAGSKSLSTQAGKAWAPGQPVALSLAGAPTTAQMLGTVTSYNSTTGSMVVDVPVGGASGSGTYADWVIALTGPRGAAGQLPDVLHTSSGNAVTGARNLIGAAGITLTLPTVWAPGDAIEFAETISAGATYTLAFGTTPLRGRTVGTQMLSAAAGSSGVLRYYDVTRGLA